MISSFSGILFLLGSLPVLIALWIGVVHLSKKGRTGHWWCMLAGAILITLQPVLWIAVEVIYRAMNGPMTHYSTTLMVTSRVSTLGYLLFMIGFAIHAIRLSRMRGRIEELEMMNLAQATELERLRNR